jgi:Anti-sigma factor NepR
MGERGKTEEMKNPRTNLEPAERVRPQDDRPETVDSMGRPVTPQKPDVRLGREAQARIGQQLRAMYEEFVNQGVPQHITDLVRRLSDQE